MDHLPSPLKRLKTNTAIVISQAAFFRFISCKESTNSIAAKASPPYGSFPDRSVPFLTWQEGNRLAASRQKPLLLIIIWFHFQVVSLSVCSQKPPSFYHTAHPAVLFSAERKIISARFAALDSITLWISFSVTRLKSLWISALIHWLK